MGVWYKWIMLIEKTLTDIAVIVTVALFCGVALEKCKQPAVLGYILAGVMLGPSGLGVLKDREVVSLLAELGILMLLFVVGMELSLRSFVKIWPIAVGCVLLQILSGLAIAFSLAQLFAWPLTLTLLLAFTFALSSTAVAVKILDTIGELRTEVGRLTIGVLIAQDLAVIPIILILRGLGESGEPNLPLMSLKILVSIGVLAILVWYLSRRERLRLSFLRTMVAHPDLTPLVGLMFCFGAAAIAGLSGLSAAYGAFLSGLVLGNSNKRPVILERMTPIYSVLMMIFFLSVGLLLDLNFIWENWTQILMILLFITLGKTALNISILHLLRQPWTLSFCSGVVLGQLGEFSFLLSSIGEEVGIVDSYGVNLIVSLTVLSLMLSPLWMTIARQLHDLAPKPTTTLPHLLSLLYGQEVSLLKRVGQKIKAAFYARPSD